MLSGDVFLLNANAAYNELMADAEDPSEKEERMKSRREELVDRVAEGGLEVRSASSRMNGYIKDAEQMVNFYSTSSVSCLKSVDRPLDLLAWTVNSVWSE